MGFVIEYRYEYDDPYKVLAYSILGNFRPVDVVRILTEDSYIQSLILKETREQDVKGRFLDCIVEDILSHRQRMEYMSKLDELSAYFFSKLDKERLRREIRLALDKAGIVLPDYPSVGSVSSANT